VYVTVTNPPTFAREFEDAELSESHIGSIGWRIALSKAYFGGRMLKDDLKMCT
jgi:hypothetical protein